MKLTPVSHSVFAIIHTDDTDDVRRPLDVIFDSEANAEKTAKGRPVAKLQYCADKRAHYCEIDGVIFYAFILEGVAFDESRRMIPPGAYKCEFARTSDGLVGVPSLVLAGEKI